MSLKNTKIKDLILELEKINDWFQSQEMDIEEGIVKLKKAQELVKEVKVRIGNVENEFIDIKKRLEEDISDVTSE